MQSVYVVVAANLMRTIMVFAMIMGRILALVSWTIVDSVRVVM